MVYQAGPDPTPLSLAVGPSASSSGIAISVSSATPLRYIVGGLAGGDPVAYGVNPALVVAASDAPLALRQVADYVCDGTDDHQEINSAITAAATAGVGVQLSGGTFTVDGEITAASDVRVYGLGYGTVVSPASGMDTSKDIFQIDTVDRFSVSDLRVTGSAGNGRSAFKIGTSAADIQLRNLYIDSPNTHAIGAAGSSDGNVARLSIDNVYVTNAGAGAGTGQGVVIGEYTSECSVTNLWATGCQESGLHTFNNDPGVADNPIRHRFANIHTWSNGSHGISLQETDELVIVNFITWSNTTHGIRVNDCTYASVSNGVTRTNGNDGYAANSGCTYMLAENITSEGNTDNGFDSDAPAALFTNCQAIGQDGTGDRGWSLGANSDGSKMTNCIADGNDVNIFTNASSSNLFFLGGRIVNEGTTAVTDNATGTIFKDVEGYVTAASGTGSITSGGTTDVITHGLDVTPTVDDILITLAEDPTNSPGAIWVDTITSTQFTVNCENDPGASNLDFGWRAITT